MPIQKANPTTSTQFTARGGKGKLIQALQRQVLLGVDPSLPRIVANKVELVSLRKNKILTSQGDIASDIYFILSGSVSIIINEREVARRGPGEHVGEMAMVDTAARRSASIIAIEPCVLAKLTEIQFTRLGNSHPLLWRAVAMTLADRLRERSKFLPAPHAKPAIFIGSSTEGLEVARSLYDYFNRLPVVPILWTDGAFQASRAAIEDLMRHTSESDFAIIVLTPDDTTKSRGVLKTSPRDNAIFELGLFMGALGRDRTYMLCPRRTDIKIPTDLLGVTRLLYQTRGRKSLAHRLRSAKQHVHRLILKYGPR